MHRGAGVLFEQLHDQFFHGHALRCRSRVLGRLAVGSHAADVANAYGVRVMTFAVRPRTLHAAPRVDLAVTVDDIVVSYAGEAAGTVPLVYLGHGVVPTLGGRSTVQDYFRYRSQTLAELDCGADNRGAAFCFCERQANSPLTEVYQVAVVEGVILCLAVVECCRAIGFHHTTGIKCN